MYQFVKIGEVVFNKLMLRGSVMSSYPNTHHCDAINHSILYVCVSGRIIERILLATQNNYCAGASQIVLLTPKYIW